MERAVPRRSADSEHACRRWCVAVCTVATLGALVAACGGTAAPTAPTPTPTSPTPAPQATLTLVAVTASTVALNVGDSVTATARAQYSDGTSQDVTAEATWGATNPTILAVTGPGRATAVGVGAVVLRATLQDKVGAVAINVSIGARSLVDQPDDISGAQVKVLYVIPSDRVDRQLDLDGTLTRSIAVAQAWLRQESGGYRFRMDTRGGQPDITGVRLDLTDAQVMGGGVRQRDLLERELIRRGFNVLGKIYVAYYEGGHQSTCGDGFLPPSLPGNLVAIYLHGTPPGARPCDTNPFATTEGFPGYLEFSFAHEIFHGMGFVATCAPHSNNGHVGDDPTDLMYAGSQPWAPSRLDPGRDDYFGHGRTNCPDAVQSPYLAR